MNYKVIGDSCCDYTPELKADPHFTIVPLTLEIGDYTIIDDEKFDQKDFLRRVAESPIGPKTACPSPEAYRDAIEKADADEVYIITLSQHLSGSFQSAVVGQQMYEEETPEADRKKVRVFSSDSASSGQLNLCLLIKELKEEGTSFEEVCRILDEKIDVMKTWFVLESLETLRKNGRLSAVKSLIASALNIKPVMSAEHGVIIKVDQQRGMNKALKKMIELSVAHAGGPEKTKDLRLCIAHVNNPERAAFVKEEYLKVAPFRDVVITDTMGVATIYGNDGGIIVAL
jgi:DegV family protein with EDD domain